MDKVKKGLSNQAIGFLPLLLFIVLGSYLSYMLSFIISLSCGFISIFLFYTLTKSKIYMFGLWPVAITFLLYSMFLGINIRPALYSYFSVVVEILLVVGLAFVGFSRRSTLFRLRKIKFPLYKQNIIRTSLNEFYFISQIFQNLITLHLFIILLYTHTTFHVIQNVRLEHFLYQDLTLIIGLGIVIYEQIRISMIRGSLRKEMWLPVLNDQGKVVGSMARSVSHTANKKYYHPVVRLAVIYKGMLYLVKRDKKETVSPGNLDYPFTRFVVFRESIEATAQEIASELNLTEKTKPRFLIRYTFENEQVKQLVSLYAITLKTEEQINKFKGGKLWTTRQIDENLDAGVFSEYFEQEFPYLENTILLAENFINQLDKLKEIEPEALS